MRALLAVLVSLVLALAVSACGSDDSDSKSSDSGGGGEKAGSEIKKNPANSGKSLTVGSKNFTEQYILGEIYVQALQAAGYKVKKDLDLGSEQIAYKALKGGQIDGYPEYTGTSLTSFFKIKTDAVPKDPDKAYQEAKAKYAKQGITALARTKFENTYKVGTTKDIQKDKLGGATKLSELKPAEVAKLKLAGFPECRQRTDCYIGLQRNYKLKPEFVSTEQTYAALDNGQAELAAVFSTDGKLTSGKYTVIEDDKGLFPPYNISFGIDTKKLKELGPDAEKVIVDVQKGLTLKNMQNLNSRVDIDKDKPAEVARLYLESEGFIKKGS